MTICEKCGSARPKIDEACPACHFRPRTRRELATAAVLTSEFKAGDETYGTPRAALDRIAREIEAGQPPAIQSSELARHQRALELFLSITGWDLASMVARFFVPALLFLAGLLLLLLLLRACNPHRRHASVTSWQPNSNTSLICS